MYYLYLFVILCILYTILYKQENLENETLINYYTDSTGTHPIKTLKQHKFKLSTYLTIHPFQEYLVLNLSNIEASLYSNTYLYSTQIPL